MKYSKYLNLCFIHSDNQKNEGFRKMCRYDRGCYGNERQDYEGI